MNEESLHHRVLRIKNMVCQRCIRVVREELENIGLKVLNVTLGTATVEEKARIDLEAVKAALTSNGLDLLPDKSIEFVERIKLAIIDLIHTEKISELTTNVSVYLAGELGKEYSTISKAFNASEGIALNQYVVLQKIERAKELISYDELPLSVIAKKLRYKSLQHLSRQFKEVTGITISTYKKQGGTDRLPIDNLH